MEAFGGTWIIESSDNFEGYMYALGVNFVLRKLGNLAKPTQEVKINGDEFYVKTTTGKLGRTSELTFTIGEEFEETTIDGRKVKSKVTREEDGTLIHEQMGTPKSTITRSIKDGKYVMVLECGDQKCTRVYVKPQGA